LDSLFERSNNRSALSGRYIEIDKTASLDRIDSSKGYITGNLQWLHKDINWMKNSFSQEDFIKLCRDVTRYQKSSR
jgi:hypothetical protein